MPELPEVETVCRGLRHLLSDQPKVREIRAARKDVRDPIPLRMIRAMVGHRLESVDRRGKYILFRTAAGFLLSHLGMTGSWRAAQGIDRDRHDHFEIHFENGLCLVYRDPRRFGIIDWGVDAHQHPRLKDLGPEPFSTEFNSDYLRHHARGRKTPIKNLLMDASFVVGVGNIYANEVLFRAGIRPHRQAGRLKAEESVKIPELVRQVLQRAIDAGGSSISDYVQANGDTGFFQDQFRVYDRDGQPCVVCVTPIRRRVISGRSTFFCPHCQR